MATAKQPGRPPDDQAPRTGLRLIGRAALGVALIAVLTAAATASAGLLVVHDVVTKIHPPGHPALPHSWLDPVADSGPQTILILGSDHRAGLAAAGLQGKFGNSDTMMLVHLDPDKPATTVLSIPRDLQVAVPGFGVSKINAAYAEGGTHLALETVRQLLGLHINHVVNIAFLGFERAVNAVGCIYVDVDRKYFNDNAPPAGGGGAYAVIDVPAGYQRLCGEDALSYVRFRHLDSDFLRAARQQDFLDQAKTQLKLSSLLDNGDKLLSIFGKNTQTDLHGDNEVLELLKLVVESAGHPTQQIRFQGDTPPPAFAGAPAYVTVTPEHLQEARDEFLNATAPPKAKTPKKKKHKKHKKKASTTPARVPAGLMDGAQAGQDEAVGIVTSHPGFPVYYPKLMTSTGQYQSLWRRAYKIKAQDGHWKKAYRIVADSGLNGPGHYYGIQGTTWTDPPILSDPTESVVEGGRTFDLFYNGKRLRTVAWHTPKAVYWVSNTLQGELSYGQMLGIAKSLTAMR